MQGASNPNTMASGVPNLDDFVMIGSRRKEEYLGSHWRHVGETEQGYDIRGTSLGSFWAADSVCRTALKI